MVRRIERLYFIFYSFHATLSGRRENFISFPKPSGKYNVSSEFVNVEKSLSLKKAIGFILTESN